MPHGNVIETTGGFVDIDTACSGIRSLQAALMLALFFGERLLILPVPTDGDSVPAQDRACFRREKAVVRGH